MDLEESGKRNMERLLKERKDVWAEQMGRAMLRSTEQDLWLPTASLRNGVMGVHQLVWGTQLFGAGFVSRSVMEQWGLELDRAQRGDTADVYVIDTERPAIAAVALYFATGNRPVVKKKGVGVWSVGIRKKYTSVSQLQVLGAKEFRLAELRGSRERYLRIPSEWKQFVEGVLPHTIEHDEEGRKWGQEHGFYSGLHRMAYSGHLMSRHCTAEVGWYPDVGEEGVEVFYGAPMVCLPSGCVVGTDVYNEDELVGAQDMMYYDVSDKFYGRGGQVMLVTRGQMFGMFAYPHRWEVEM